MELVTFVFLFQIVVIAVFWVEFKRTTSKPKQPQTTLPSIEENKPSDFNKNSMLEKLTFSLFLQSRFFKVLSSLNRLLERVKNCSWFQKEEDFSIEESIESENSQLEKVDEIATTNRSLVQAHKAKRRIRLKLNTLQFQFYKKHNRKPLSPIKEAREQF